MEIRIRNSTEPTAKKQNFLQKVPKPVWYSLAGTIGLVLVLVILACLCKRFKEKYPEGYKTPQNKIV